MVGLGVWVTTDTKVIRTPQQSEVDRRLAASSVGRVGVSEPLRGLLNDAYDPVLLCDSKVNGTVVVRHVDHRVDDRRFRIRHIAEERTGGVWPDPAIYGQSVRTLKRLDRAFSTAAEISIDRSGVQ